jgi:hypothetical protein
MNHIYSKQQLKYIAKLNLHLPIDLSILFANTLYNHIHSLQSSHLAQSSYLSLGFEYLRIDTKLPSLYKLWKSGEISPIELYQSIEMAKNNTHTLSLQGTVYSTYS